MNSTHAPCPICFKIFPEYTCYFDNDAASVIDYVLPDHHGQLYVILSLVVHLVIFKLFTEF